MILSRYFVFLHFPKTGGSFLRKLCSDYGPRDWEIRIVDGHPTISHIPDSHQSLPILGLVRNPFDWYISWYTYLKQRGDNVFFNQVSDQGRKNFKETLLSVFNLDLAALLQTDCNFKNSSYGCYVNHHFGNRLDRVKLGKFENLRTDLEEILSKIVPMPTEFKHQLLTYPKVNESNRSHYRDYYDEELREIVLERDQAVLDEFGYEF